MYVVVWEPKHGRGGGHQAVMEQHKAEWISRRIGRDKPDCSVRVETAADFAAEAVRERGARRRHG